MNLLNRFLKYHLKSFIATEILLLLLFLFFISFTNIFFERYINTISLLNKQGIKEIFLLQGSDNASSSQNLYISNGNILVKAGDKPVKCNVVLTGGSIKHAYVDEQVFKNMKQNYVGVEYDDVSEEVKASSIASLCLPYFHNNYPLVILTGCNDFIMRYNLLSIDFDSSDLSSYTIVDSTNVQVIKIKLLRLFLLWNATVFVILYFVRRFTPVYGKVPVTEVYRYLNRLGSSKKIVIHDSLFFGTVTYCPWLIVSILYIKHSSVCVILSTILIQIVVIPVAIEVLIIRGGFKKWKI